MTAQAIPVRTKGPAKTELTGLIAAVHQVLMELNVKQVKCTCNTKKYQL